MQIVELPIHILVDLIHSGKLDPREVFNSFCNNIFKFNHNLNAFITVDCEEKDLFFHRNELKGVSYEELKVGDRVSFEKTDSPKGPNATNVTRI